MNNVVGSEIRTTRKRKGGDLYLHVPTGVIYIVSVTKHSTGLVLTSLVDGLLWAHDGLFEGHDDEFEKLLPGTQLTLTVKE